MAWDKHVHRCSEHAHEHMKEARMETDLNPAAVHFAVSQNKQSWRDLYHDTSLRVRKNMKHIAWIFNQNLCSHIPITASTSCIQLVGQSLLTYWNLVPQVHLKDYNRSDCVLHMLQLLALGFSFDAVYQTMERKRGQNFCTPQESSPILALPWCLQFGCSAHSPIVIWLRQAAWAALEANAASCTMTFPIQWLIWMVRGCVLL